jgi:ABC-type branched-subunit amino acid transport system substrate-binding protein
VTSQAQRASRRFPIAVLAIAFATAGTSPALFATELSESQLRGKQIYFEGTSAQGTDITAVVGDEAAMLPGSTMPCSSCHGSDGLGRPEGGVIPLDIRWTELVKTYGHVHHDGRRHPAFDDDSFIRSMIAGIDPANNPLDRSMPIYQMSGEDMADLVAYMKVLEHDLDPGVGDDSVQVATLLPLAGKAGETGRAMRQVLEGYFSEINKNGGVFGRQIKLLAGPTGESPEASLEKLREAFDSEGIFALVGAYTIGLDDELLTLLRSDNVPMVGPFTLDPGDAYFDSAAFYLYAGLDQQARVLADRAVADGAVPGKVMIVGPEGGRAEGLANAARDQLRKKDRDDPPAVESYADGGFDAAGLAKSVAEQGLQALIFLGAQSELDALVRELANQVPVPRIYLLSSLVSRPLAALPTVFDQRVFLAYPTLSSDITPRGRQDYQELAKAYSWANDHVQARLAAFAAAKLFVEGLRKGGRDLSRVRLVEGLESLYQFDTGVTPPLSYGPNRRIGARGAHVLMVDLANKTYKPVGKGWFDVQ